MSVQTQNVRTFFIGDNIATTNYIYNSDNENTAAAGWVRCAANEVVCQVGCATKLAAGNLEYRIEGKFNTLDRAASLATGSFSTAESVDRLINIDKRIEEIRVGVRLGTMVSTPVASPTNFYSGVCLTSYN